MKENKREKENRWRIEEEVRRMRVIEERRVRLRKKKTQPTCGFKKNQFLIHVKTAQPLNPLNKN